MGPVRRDKERCCPYEGCRSARHETLMRPGMTTGPGPAVCEMTAAEDEDPGTGHHEEQKPKAGRGRGRASAKGGPDGSPREGHDGDSTDGEERMRTAQDITTMAAEVATVSGADHCQPMVSCAHMPRPKVTKTAAAHAKASSVLRVRSECSRLLRFSPA